MSDKYKQLNPKKANALIVNREMNINSSFLFHSILDAASIKTDVLDSLQSIFFNSQIDNNKTHSSK